MTDRSSEAIKALKSCGVSETDTNERSRLPTNGFLRLAVKEKKRKRSPDERDIIYKWSRQSRRMHHRYHHQVRKRNPS